MIDEKIWLNQVLLFHKDSYYNSFSSLDISLCSNTSDFKSFSTVNLNISILTEKMRKVYGLNYQNAYDLLNSIKEVIPNISKAFTSNISIVKRHYSDKSLKIDFTVINNESVVAISILGVGGDTFKIIVPYNTIFIPFCNLLKTYISDYIKLNLDLTSRAISSEIQFNINELKNSVKALPTFLIPSIDKIINQDLTQENKLIEVEVGEEKRFDDFTETINDLDSFLGKDMQNISIPDLDNIEVKESLTRVIKSELVNNVLKNDLSKMEFLIKNISTSDNPLKSLISRFKESFENKNIEFLPNISIDEEKSFCYISKCLYSYYFHRYVNQEIAIPSSTVVLKYNPTNYSDDNLNLAYDLLLISAYIRSLRSKLELKESSSVKNKGLLFLELRLFTDPLVFSFIENIDPNIIRSCVSERFIYYKSIGFFKEYENLLDSYKCEKVSESEISSIIREFCEKVIVKKVPFIKDLHNLYIEKKFFRLPFSNNLELEQIINQAIPLQNYIFINADINNDKSVVDSINEYNESLSDEVRKIFLTFKKKKEVREKESNIVRAFKLYSTEIPERLRNEVIEYAKLVEENKFDLCVFPIEEFGENIIKVLYVWNENEKGILYTDFMSKVESCLMTKELILTKYKSDNAPVEFDESWGSILSKE